MFANIIGSIFNRRENKSANLNDVQEYLGSSNSEAASQDMLIAVWKDVLNIGEVNQGDNFFELGGTSMQLFIMVQRMNEIYGTDLTVLDVMDIETLAEIASYAEKIRVSVGSGVQS